MSITVNHPDIPATEVKIIICNNPDNLEVALREAEAQGWETATVETEYGSRVIKGSFATLAHHAPDWRDKPCPCLHVETRWIPAKLLIGGSHFDLDTLGGMMSVLGIRPGMLARENRAAYSFWHSAAHIDTAGPHRINEVPEENHAYLHAFWSWSQENRLFPPRDGSVLEVTNYFQDAMDTICAILRGNKSLMRAGYEWADKIAELEKDSFVSEFSFSGHRGLVREAEKFVNALYEHDGSVYDAIIGVNTETVAITLSFERPGVGNACEIMQTLFGPEAGGHAGIAGTPRNIQYTLEDAHKIIAHLMEG